MDSNDSNFTKKNEKKYVCNFCHFNTYKKTDYTRHLSTDKHKINKNGSVLVVNDSEKTKKNEINLYKCNCGKIYKYDSGYYRHKKKCIHEYKKEISENKNIVDKEMIEMLIKQNTKLMEIMENGINNTNSYNTTNSHNKSFNLNFFLNETCKDAMNIMDFVDSIKLQLSDLEKVGKLGYIEGISNIIVKNLKALDVTERPVHCTDSKRETLYIKDENKWEKENDEKNKMKKAIKRVANKNIGLLNEFKKMYPDCMYSESKKSDQYNKIIIEAFELNNPEKQEKVIKNIAKEVILDKKIL